MSNKHKKVTDRSVRAAIESVPQATNGLPIAASFKDAPAGISYLCTSLCIKNKVLEGYVPLPGYEGKAAVNWVAEPIPMNLVDIALAFFRAVHEKHDTEAGVVLFYRDGEWQMVCPTQEVSGANCEMDLKDCRLGDGWQMASIWHSHGDMSAFASGTDVADQETLDGLHVTFGKIDQTTPEYHAEIVLRGYRRKIEFAEVLEKPGAAAIPEGWMEAVTKKNYGVPTGPWRGHTGSANDDVPPLPFGTPRTPPKYPEAWQGGYKPVYDGSAGLSGQRRDGFQPKETTGGDEKENGKSAKKGRPSDLAWYEAHNYPWGY